MTLPTDFLAMLLDRSAEPTTLPTLYHGTTRSRAERILAEGLLPRAQTGVTTSEDARGAKPWQRSDGACVYLSSTHAAFFALNRALDFGEPAAVVEAPRSSILREALLPDEDALVAGFSQHRGGYGGAEEYELAKAATRPHRNLWPASLAMSGVVAHEGPILGSSRAFTISLTREETVFLNSVVKAFEMLDVAIEGRRGRGSALRDLMIGMTAWSVGEDAFPWEFVEDYSAMRSEAKKRLRSIFAKRWEPIV